MSQLPGNTAWKLEMAEVAEIVLLEASISRVWNEHDAGFSITADEIPAGSRR